MPEYPIHVDQQWVGDHDAAWFRGRVAPSTAVVRHLQDEGVLVFAGGLVEDLAEASHADVTGSGLVMSDGPFGASREWIGGLTIVDVPDDQSAPARAGRVAQGCGWPQQVRHFTPGTVRAGAHPEGGRS